MARDGKKLYRDEYKLVPTYDEDGEPTVKESLTSRMHQLDCKAVDFLKDWKPADIPHLLKVLRAKYPTFDQVYRQHPGANELLEERENRRLDRIRQNRAIRRANTRRIRNGEEPVPEIEVDSDDEAFQRTLAPYRLPLSFFANKSQEHYPDDPQATPHDSVVQEVLTDMEDTDGESFNNKPTKKRRLQ